MKRLSYLFLALFLCAFTLGCGGDKAGTANPNPPPEPGAHDEAVGEAGPEDGGSGDGTE